MGTPGTAQRWRVRLPSRALLRGGRWRSDATTARACPLPSSTLPAARSADGAALAGDGPPSHAAAGPAALLPAGPHARAGALPGSRGAGAGWAGRPAVCSRRCARAARRRPADSPPCVSCRRLSPSLLPSLPPLPAGVPQQPRPLNDHHSPALDLPPSLSPSLSPPLLAGIPWQPRPLDCGRLCPVHRPRRARQRARPRQRQPLLGAVLAGGGRGPQQPLLLLLLRRSSRLQSAWPRLWRRLAPRSSCCAAKPPSPRVRLEPVAASPPTPPHAAPAAGAHAGAAAGHAGPVWRAPGKHCGGIASRGSGRARARRPAHAAAARRALLSCRRSAAPLQHPCPTPLTSLACPCTCPFPCTHRR